MGVGVNTWIRIPEIQRGIGGLPRIADAEADIHPVARDIASTGRDMPGWAWGDINRADHVPMADDPGAPDRVSPAVMANEIAFGVNRGAAGQVAADIYPALIAVGVRLRGGTEDDKGEGCQCGCDGFHDDGGFG